MWCKDGRTIFMELSLEVSSRSFVEDGIKNIYVYLLKHKAMKLLIGNGASLY